ncbi:MAG: cytochrome c biogenesis protein CcsA [Magnetococcus sp. DMHC-1]|nr:cytochrome c biogenesis protein CcsA [Magnetococcales bacterium]
MNPEWMLTWGAMILYLLAGLVAVVAMVLDRHPDRTILALLALGLLVHAVALGLRWQRLGHGPFINLYEILSSNIWSLLLIYALVFWRMPIIRRSAAVILPMLFLLMGWLLVTTPGDSRLPPTYHTLWLYFHVGFGKIFLGALLVGAGLGVAILLRMTPRGELWFRSLPDDARLDELSYRFLVLGLIFDTMMLIIGAIWAQDAWGRYWSWDPLETWSLITWLFLALALHVRPLLNPSPRWGAVSMLLIFLVAFLTFFGVPFVSLAPHKGVI